MKYRIVHKTRYDYGYTVSLCHNTAWILPRGTDRQTCLKSMVVVNPEPSTLNERSDYFGNRVSYFAIQHPHDHLVVTATSEIQVDPRLSVDLNAGPAWDEVRGILLGETHDEALYARHFILESLSPAAASVLLDFTKDLFTPGRPVLEAAHALMAAIYTAFDYVPGFTDVSTPLEEVMHHRRGVCQDFAHVAIACLRLRGVPARYISGYLETRPPPGKPKLVGADASHAWFAVYAPNAGWVDFDPTNNVMPDEQHVTVAWGRDFTDVTPLKGVMFGSGNHRLSVSVDVSPVDEASENK